MSEQELRVVIKSCAARERSKSLALRSLHKRTRLAAIEVYLSRFGRTEFVAQLCERKLPPLPNMWLPRGYARFKARSNQAFNPTPTPPLCCGARSG